MQLILRLHLASTTSLMMIHEDSTDTETGGALRDAERPLLERTSGVTANVATASVRADIELERKRQHIVLGVLVSITMLRSFWGKASDPGNVFLLLLSIMGVFVISRFNRRIRERDEELDRLSR
jgi:hypothetical protein